MAGDYRKSIRIIVHRYSHLFFADEYCEQFASLCVQLLNLLLDFDPATYLLDATPCPSEEPRANHTLKPELTPEPQPVSIPESISPEPVSNCSVTESSPELGVGDLFKSPILDDVNLASAKAEDIKENDPPTHTNTRSLLEDVPLEIDITGPSLRAIIFGPETSGDIKLPKLLGQAVPRIRLPSDLCRLFGVVDQSHSVLPASVHQISVYPEIMILLWRLIDLNSAFFKFIVYEESILDFVSALTYYASEAELDQCKCVLLNPAADGLVHLSCFVLLQLSSERELAIRLNTPYTDFRVHGRHLPEFSGSYGDFFVLSMTLSPVTTHRLIALFEQLARLSVDRSSIPHAKCAHLLLRTFTTMMQYQYDGMVCLIAGLMRSRAFFETLAKWRYSDYVMGEGIGSIFKRDPEMQAEISSTHRWTEEECLDPDLKLLLKRDDAVVAEDEMVRFLRKRTLVGLVPLNYPLQVIRFRMSPEIQSWLTSYMYGIVCLHQEQASIWNNTAIKLFVVRYEDSEQGMGLETSTSESECHNDIVLPLMP
ncbi:hypothetical protein DI09_20p70 [Mitosporidium daphniae]|uniref:Uncharacterized protein n=1 Tax=Mitosporidium daphniae TaxID=1485682 RepID=A0A098VSX6_9MICR|nr:uncharacterized protein DI09_20p70 [Mitosporidium daphniae]KGG52090.1 hypothetical protein DI09_20p70 [Mitosporidium daphniae]|eukprot:XP_013238548.1 uncharacterized protein DI09_20p70 [Mitosporidium daphniae]